VEKESSLPKEERKSLEMSEKKGKVLFSRLTERGRHWGRVNKMRGEKVLLGMRKKREKKTVIECKRKNSTFGINLGSRGGREKKKHVGRPQIKKGKTMNLTSLEGPMQRPQIQQRLRYAAARGGRKGGRDTKSMQRRGKSATVEGEGYQGTMQRGVEGG